MMCLLFCMHAKHCSNGKGDLLTMKNKSTSSQRTHLYLSINNTSTRLVSKGNLIDKSGESQTEKHRFETCL